MLFQAMSVTSNLIALSCIFFYFKEFLLFPALGLCSLEKKDDFSGILVLIFCLFSADLSMRIMHVASNFIVLSCVVLFERVHNVYWLHVVLSMEERMY